LKEEKSSFIRDLIAKGESRTVEFLKTLDLSDSKDQEKLIKSIVAFANSTGGYIIIGIDDSGEICGIPRDAFNPDDLNMFIIDSTTPDPHFESYMVPFDDRYLGLITIHKSQVPIVTKRGKFFVRRGGAPVSIDISSFFKQKKLESESRTLLVLTFIAVIMGFVINFLSAFLSTIIPTEAVILTIFVIGVTAIITSLSFLSSQSTLMVETITRRAVTYFRRAFPLIIGIVIFLEFCIAFFWVSFNLGMLLLLAMFHFVIYLLLGAVDFISTTKLRQWIGLLTVAVLLGLGLIFIPETLGLSNIAVEITGVLIGIVAGISISESWKEMDSRRSIRELDLRIINELSMIQEQVLAYDEVPRPWPVWESAISSGAVLQISRERYELLSNAYRAAETYDQTKSSSNKVAVLSAISAVFE